MPDAIVTLDGAALTAARTYDFPDTDGTFVLEGALTSSGLTIATSRLAGRTTSGTGALEEISVGSGLTFSSGSLSANVTSVAGRTGAVTLSTSDISGLGTLALLNSVDMTANVTGILPSANGGTGNGFTRFSGPSGSEKTFTLPNATSTILTTNAVVTVAQGGTGATSLTGYVKGNGASAFTAAASIPSSDITGLGTASSEDIGTSGSTVPMLDGTNDWSALQTFQSGIEATDVSCDTATIANSATVGNSGQNGTTLTILSGGGTSFSKLLFEADGESTVDGIVHYAGVMHLVADNNVLLQIAAGAAGVEDGVTIGLAPLIVANATRFKSLITPAQITTDVDDYDPTGLAGATVLRLSTDANRSLSGIVGGTVGRWLVLFNVGSQTLTLLNDSSSTAANRFLIAGGNLAVAPNGSVRLWYDSSSSRWRVIS